MNILLVLIEFKLILVILNIFKCNNDKDSKCCCEPVLGDNNNDNVKQEGEVVVKEDKLLVTVDVWSAFPNGTYPKLRQVNTNDDNDNVDQCHGKQQLSTKSSTNQLLFYSLAPGSTGALNGLGPNGYDLPPWGPPAIHVLVTSHLDTHDHLLLDIPILYTNHYVNETSSTTVNMTYGTFTGPDLRGSAWMGNKGASSTSSPYYEMKSFRTNSMYYHHTNHTEYHTTVELDIYLQPKKEKPLLKPCCSKSKQRSLEKYEHLCQSTIYGTSFFLEPISICAPTLLDYFDL